MADFQPSRPLPPVPAPGGQGDGDQRGQGALMGDSLDAGLSEQTFRFLSAAQAATSPPALDRAFSTQVRSMGYDSFVCAQLSGAGAAPSREHFFGQWDPLWEAHYMGRHLYRDDPALHEAMRRTDSFAWSDIERWRELNPRERRVLDEARDFGFNRGFTTPVRNLDGSMALVVLFGRDADEDAQSRAALHIMSLYYAGAARRILHDRDRERDLRLTDREKQIVTLLARGDRQHEIADRLAISERTVEHHLENARQRIGAVNSVQLCVDAIRMGLVYL